MVEPGLLPEEEVYELDCDKRIAKIVNDYFSLSWNKWVKMYGDVELVRAIRESGCVAVETNSMGQLHEDD